MSGVTGLLIALNVVVYALEAQGGEAFVTRFALWPLQHTVPGGSFHWWQLVTSAFLHAGGMHLGLNMLALWMFGRDVERVLGARRYAALYFAAVLGAAVVQLAVVTLTFRGEAYPTVGASGGVFGLLLAFAMLFPRRTIVLIFPPIPMPAWLFVLLYGAVELVQGVVGTQAGVAHFAHLGGMLGAWLLIQRWKRRARR